MAPPDGGTRTPIAPGLVARLTQGVRYALTGTPPDTWMGPGQPIAPMAQEVAGRQFDYPVSINTVIQPRSNEAVSFSQLRGLADTDLVRLCIETRKDQMEKLEWKIQHRETAEEDDRAKALEEMLAFPDLEHEFGTWLRMLLEDLLAIDAATIYPWKTKGGKHYALEVVDGATIKRIVDGNGRTPMTGAAYQQILKGMPVADFTRDELIYLPRNVRSHRLYGYSAVEQIIITVNTEIRRALHQLDYYTEGSIPDAIASVPATWNIDQITRFQNQWDAMMTGPQNSAMRRKIKFVPDAVGVTLTKSGAIFDEGDEWLARVICYAFSLPPNAFVKQQNRATAVSAQEVALEEGLAPLMQWVKRMMDRVLAGPLGQPDYEFTWGDIEEVDQLTQAQVDQIYVTTGVKTVDEVRDNLDLPPLLPLPTAPVAPAAVGPDGQPIAPAGDPSKPTPSPALPAPPGPPAAEKLLAAALTATEDGNRALLKARRGRRAGRSLPRY